MPFKNGASSGDGIEFATRTLNPLIRYLPRMISTLLTSSSEIMSRKDKAWSKGAPVIVRLGGQAVRWSGGQVVRWSVSGV